MAEAYAHGSSFSATSTTSTIMTFTALDALRDSGIVVASDGAQYLKIAEFSPTDATTNPSLVYSAICSEGSEYSHLLTSAVSYGVEHGRDLESRTQLALDHLLVSVGVNILALIPGRVSLSIDPRLFLPTTASPFDQPTFQRVLDRCLALHTLAVELLSSKNIDAHERILLKIPASSLGIAVARTLEAEHRIHTNMTLIFSPIQALACAQAGVSVISPFVGRVKDFYDSRSTSPASTSLSEHPGIVLVRTIKSLYRALGYTTEIMAAGFRSVDEIIELGSRGAQDGPDLMTLPPDLLAGLRSRDGIHSTPQIPSAPPTTHSATYFESHSPPTSESVTLFESHIKDEEIAFVKVAEGLEKFSVDAGKLDERVRTEIVRVAAPKLDSAASQETESSVSSASSVSVDSAIPTPSPKTEATTSRFMTIVRSIQNRLTSYRRSDIEVN